MLLQLFSSDKLLFVSSLLHISSANSSFEKRKSCRKSFLFPFSVGLEVNWAYVNSISSQKRQTHAPVMEGYKQNGADVEPLSLPSYSFQTKKVVERVSYFPFGWLAGKQVP